MTQIESELDGQNLTAETQKVLPRTNHELREFLGLDPEKDIPGEKFLLFAEARRSLENEYGATLDWQTVEEIEVHGERRTVRSATYSTKGFARFVRGRSLATIDFEKYSEIVHRTLQQACNFDPEVQKKIDIIGEIASSEPHTFWGRINERFEEKGIVLTESDQRNLRRLNAMVMAIPHGVLRQVKEETSKIITVDETVDEFGMQDYEIGLATDIEGIPPLGDLNWGRLCPEKNEIVERTLQEEFALGWTSDTQNQVNTKHAGFPSLLKDLMETHGNMLSPKARILIKMHHVPGFPGARLRNDIECGGWKELVKKVAPKKMADFLNKLTYAGLESGNFFDNLARGISSLSPRESLQIGHSYSGARIKDQGANHPIIGYILNPAVLPINLDIKDKYQWRFRIVSRFLSLASHIPIPDIVRNYFTNKISTPLMGPTDPTKLTADSQYPAIADSLTQEHGLIVGTTPINVTAAVLASMIQGTEDSVGVANPILTADQDFLTHPDTISSNLRATAQKLHDGLKKIGFTVLDGDIIRLLTNLNLEGGHMECFDPANRKLWMTIALVHFLQSNNSRLMTFTNSLMREKKPYQVYRKHIYAPQELEFLSDLKMILWQLAESEFDKIPEKLMSPDISGEEREKIKSTLESMLTILKGEIPPHLHERLFTDKSHFGSLAATELFGSTCDSGPYWNERSEIQQGIDSLKNKTICPYELTTLVRWIGGLWLHFNVYAKENTGTFETYRQEFFERITELTEWKELVRLIEQVRGHPDEDLIPISTQNKLISVLNVATCRRLVDEQVKENFQWCFQSGAAQALTLERTASLCTYLANPELEGQIQKTALDIISDSSVIEIIEQESFVSDLFSKSPREFHRSSTGTAMDKFRTLWDEHKLKLQSAIGNLLEEQSLAEELRAEITEWVEDILFYTTRNYLQLSARIPSINYEELVGNAT